MGWARAVLVTLAISALQHDQYDDRTRKNDESGNVIEPPLSHVMGRIDAQPLHPKTTISCTLARVGRGTTASSSGRVA